MIKLEQMAIIWIRLENCVQGDSVFQNGLSGMCLIIYVVTNKLLLHPYIGNIMLM